MSWYGVIAAACCCEPEGPCPFCSAHAWTVSIPGGTLSWEAECDEYYVEEFDLWVSVGIQGSVSYTLPSSLTLEFVSSSDVVNACLWEGSSEWADGGSVTYCADCGGSVELYPLEYRFRTEARLVISEPSFGSGIYNASLMIVVRCERRYLGFDDDWAPINLVGSGFGSPWHYPAAAFCGWHATNIPLSTYCSVGGDLSSPDGIAPAIGSGMFGGVCQQETSFLACTSTLPWTAPPDEPGDVTITPT